MRYKLGDRKLDSCEPRDSFLDYEDDPQIEHLWEELEVARMNYDVDEIFDLKKKLRELGEDVGDKDEDEGKIDPPCGMTLAKAKAEEEMLRELDAPHAGESVN